MRAVEAHEPGGADVLVVREVADPVPLPGHVVCRVAAAGVNFADVVMRLGEARAPFPLVPGVEGAGVVEAVGPGVEGVAIGDRVAWAPTGMGSAIGSYAERELLSASMLVRVPDDISLTTAAATVLQGLTARYLVLDQYPVGPGVTVLVHAAAGGTGQMVTRWLAHLGAEVIATVSTDDKAAIARAAGAAHVIRYDETDWVAEVRRLTDGLGAHYIVDGVGRTTFAGDLRAVRARGRICLFGRAAGAPEPFQPMSLMTRSIAVSGGSMGSYTTTPEELTAAGEGLWDGLRAGWLEAPITGRFTLDEAPEAHRQLEGRASTGKLVLIIDPATADAI